MHRSLLAAAITLAFAALPLAVLPHANAAARDAVQAAQADTTTTQLPRGVVPTHYAVALTPDVAAARFSARTTITLKVTRATDSITLNAAELRFSGASLEPVAAPGTRARHDTAALTASTRVDDEAQTATFSFARPVAPGEYRLVLDYTGAIGKQAVGLFALDYAGADGKGRQALFTQFENSDARRVIPSWDEPAYKATFALELTAPAGQMAISNMPAARTTKLPDGRQHIVFAPTPKMSTYLLFFALGDFERAAVQADGTEIGVVTRRGAVSQADFALQSSSALLREYNDYFGVRYPLPKLDNVAGPGRSQFFSAMENWGAIFTFEYALLLDPVTATLADRQTVFTTAAHEMAHQWFGDLVTMRWWDDIWLNEGFASWMETRTTDRLHPEWQARLTTVAGREAAMARDSVASTHPVVQHVATVEQANQAFDEITYQKGEAVIRMLEAYVGEAAWRTGVRAYMQAHAYGNTVSGDLWKQIERAAGKPVTAIAHDFTLQPGIPLIRVGASVCRAGKTSVTLTQDEFTRDRPAKKALAWRVPVIAQLAPAAGAASTSTPAPVATLISGGKASLTLPGCGPVVVNAGQSGYYRTLYGPREFAALAQRYAALAPIDQIGLLADSAALGLAGLQPASSALDLVEATPRDADPALWTRIAQLFDGLHTRYAGAEERQRRFEAYAIARLAPVMAQTGWQARPGEAPSVANLRQELIGALGDLGDPATVAEARRRHAALAHDPQAVPAPLRKIVTAVVARHADGAAWDALHAQARAEKNPLTRSRLYELLGAPEDRALAERALRLSLTDEPGATDSAAIVAAVARQHPDLAVDFALANLKQVYASVDATSRSRYIPRLASGSSDPAMPGKLKAYAQAELAKEARGDLEAALATINDRIRVNAARLPEIDAWLQKHAR